MEFGFLTYSDEGVLLTKSRTSLDSDRVIDIKGSHEEVPYLVYNLITFTLPKRSTRATFKWRLR